MTPDPLLLCAPSSAERRRWVIDSNFDPSSGLVLPLVPSVETFGSVEDVWSMLPSEFHTRYAHDLQRFDRYVGGSRRPSGHGSAGPSLALRRRISRESGPATRAVELGASLLLGGLGLIKQQTIHVARVDELDGLSLRLLVRAVVRMTDVHDLTFIFHSTSDPRERVTPPSLSERARRSLLRNAARAGEFQFDNRTAGPLPRRPPVRASIEQAALDLVAHNYEAAFLRTENADGSDAVDGSRIAALAAVNLGDFRTAEKKLMSALDMSVDVGTSAHLCCLLALIAAKRIGDLTASERFIDMGIDLLDTGGTETDPDVERAWLLNARALNRALVFRDTRDEKAFREAHALEVEAARLVSDGSSEERMYLRFNLLANLAFLWEGRGERMNAARVFERAFASRAAVDAVSAATLGYRLAVLYAKAGDLNRAESVLRGLDDGLPDEEWSAVDHLLRARERIALQAGRYTLAEELANRGILIGLKVRSTDTVSSHGLARAEAMRRTGRHEAASRADAELLDLGLDPGGSTAVAALRSKLPAYIPEIDLEDVPVSDTNRRLAGV